MRLHIHIKILFRADVCVAHEKHWAERHGWSFVVPPYECIMHRLVPRIILT